MSNQNKKIDKSRHDLREFILNKEDGPVKDLIDEYDDPYPNIYEGFDKDSENIIEDLAKIDFKESNQKQHEGLEILKNLAESDEEIANAFMEKLSDKYTEVAKELGVV